MTRYTVKSMVVVPNQDEGPGSVAEVQEVKLHGEFDDDAAAEMLLLELVGNDPEPYDEAGDNWWECPQGDGTVRVYCVEAL